MSVGFCEATMSPNWYFLPSRTIITASELSSFAIFHASSSTTSSLRPLVVRPALLPHLLLDELQHGKRRQPAECLVRQAGKVQVHEARVRELLKVDGGLLREEVLAFARELPYAVNRVLKLRGKLVASRLRSCPPASSARPSAWAGEAGCPARPPASWSPA